MVAIGFLFPVTSPLSYITSRKYHYSFQDGLILPQENILITFKMGLANSLEQGIPQVKCMSVALHEFLREAF